jgi:hypothetical protein
MQAHEGFIMVTPRGRGAASKLAVADEAPKGRSSGPTSQSKAMMPQVS